jgi:hypothetical protein
VNHKGPGPKKASVGGEGLGGEAQVLNEIFRLELGVGAFLGVSPRGCSPPEVAH